MRVMSQRGLYSCIIVAASALLLASCASVKTFVVLLPEETGGPSAVTVGEGDRQTILEVPLSAAAVDARGNVEKSTVTTEEINRTFADALAAQPPKSISFTLYFDTKSTEVSPASQPALAELQSTAARLAELALTPPEPSRVEAWRRRLVTAARSVGFPRANLEYAAAPHGRDGAPF